MTDRVDTVYFIYPCVKKHDGALVDFHSGYTSTNNRAGFISISDNRDWRGQSIDYPILSVLRIENNTDWR